MEKKKTFSKHGIGARVLSFLLAFAMVVTMGAFSQIGQIAVKADETGINVRVHVKIPSAWGWEIPSLWYQGDSVTLEDVCEQTHITGWGDSDYGYPLKEESDDFYTGVIKGNVTNLQFLDVSAPSGRVISNAYDSKMAQYVGENTTDLYYILNDNAWTWYTDKEGTSVLPELDGVEDCTVTVHYENTSKWSKVCVQASEGGSWNAIAGYEDYKNGVGAEVSADPEKANWYTFKITKKNDTQLNLIFNAGDWGDTNQTDNINVSLTGKTSLELWCSGNKKTATKVLEEAPESWLNPTTPEEPEEPQITTCDLTVHYKNAVGADPAIYMYNSSDQIAGAWPGTYLTEDSGHEGWYYAHLSVSAEKDYTVIFNGKDGQTNDLTGMATKGKATAEYWYDESAGSVFSEALPEGWSYKTTIYYYAPTWTDAYVYMWGGDTTISGSGVGKAWPGEKATPVEGKDGWYAASFVQDAKTDFSCIFNNNNGIQTADVKVEVTSANTELWVSGTKSDGDTTISKTATKEWLGEAAKPYTFKLYYCNPDLLDTDVAATTKDLWMWNAGLNGSYKFTGTWYDEENDVTWLTQEITVEGKFIGKDVGLKARYDYTKEWDGGSDSDRSFTLDKDVTTYYYVDGKNPTGEKPVLTAIEARYINFEYVNPSLDDTAAPEFYSWTVGGVNNSKLIAMEKQADGVWSARVKVSSTCDKVDFVVALDSKADPWVKDGGDHSIAFPLAQKNLFVKMESGKEPVLSAPLNTGYEINAAEGKVNFFYRDDAALTNGTLADMTVKVEAGAESYDMTYVPGNKRFEVSLPLANGKTYYRYQVNGEYVTDAFNTNTEGKNGTTYSCLEYYKLDAVVTASVMNDKFNYNENNVVKLDVVQNKNGEEPDLKVTEASIDVSALGGSSALKIEPELMAVAISATTDTALGVKTLPIAVKDQFGNTYTAEAKVELAAREKSSAADDFDWDESVIYFMVTDRFFDGNSSNNTANGENTYGDNEGLYHGGDFAGVTAKLDYLKELGINTIWITPIVENIPGVTVTGTGNTDVPYNAAYHGYWGSNFTKLNPALGTDEELKTMIAEAHKRGIKIMVDIVVNHAGYGTEDSFNALLDGKDMIRGTEDTISGSDQKDSLSGLPDFKTEDADVRALLVKWQTEWVKNFGIDYFRVDTVKHVEGTTWAALKNALTEIDPEFKMIGEYAGGGYAGNGNTLGTGEMDSVLDFDFNDWATNFVSGKLSDVEASMTARNEKLNNTYMTGQFLGSHDEDGFKYNLINNKNMTEENAQAAALVAASLQITAKGQPVIYYGEEIGLTGANNYPYQTNRYDFDWSLVTDSNKTYQHYKKMLAIRNAYTDVFARGTRTSIAVSDTEGTDVFERAYNGQKLIVALNIGAQEKQAVLSGFEANTTYRDAYSGKDYTADENGMLTITIPAAADGGTVVLAKEQTKQPGDDKTDEKSDSKNDEKSDDKTDSKADEKSDGKTDEKSDDRTDSKTDEKSDAKTDNRTDESQAAAENKTEVSVEQPKQPVVKRNVKANVSKNAPGAKITTNAKGNATLTTLGKTKKPTVWIHSKVTIDGVDYKITVIGKNAFAKCTKATWKVTLGKGIKKINAKAFTGSRIALVDIYETQALSVSAKAFAGVDTKAMTIRVTKNMSKKEFGKLTKQLRAAGFKGNILQMKYH